MRVLQVLAFGVFMALTVALGAGTLASFGISSPAPDPIRAVPEHESAAPISGDVREAAPRPPLRDEIPAASDRKSVNATVHFESDPQGADATASLGARCRTPCSMELSADGPFLVTFTRHGFIPLTIPVRIEPSGSQAKFAPNPVFAALEHTHETKLKTKPPRTAATRGPTPTEASEATSDGLVVRSWRYVEQKTQDWQTQLVRLVRGGGSR